jgi:hypothetical protein
LKTFDEFHKAEVISTNFVLNAGDKTAIYSFFWKLREARILLG